MMTKAALKGGVALIALHVQAVPPEDLAVNMADMAYMRYQAEKRLAAKAEQLKGLIAQAEAIEAAGDE